MGAPTLDLDKFRTAFPEFANVTAYPDARLELWWQAVICAMDDAAMCDDCAETYFYLMLAHIAKLMTKAATGSAQVGAKTSATIDKVSVAYAAPPYKDGWEYWLSQTPYGIELWALLGMLAVGGLYIGGRPETRGFRKVGGRF